MRGPLHLELSDARGGPTVVREARLSCDGSLGSQKISYEIVGGIQPEEPAVLDGFVFGIFLHAMTNGTSLTVHGALSRSALYNLNELQSCWALWYPQRYKRIEIKPERIVDIGRGGPARRAIAAFSGGSDSTFTLLRHRKGLLGPASRDLDAAVMVHGFDTDLANVDHLQKLIERRKPFLDDLGLELKIIRTNIKGLGLQNWEDGHGAMLASCLHQFAGAFDTGLIASSNPYDELEFPWGSNPITDRLLSGDQFEIVHDGAGYAKIEKIALISQHPLAMAGLRVCYEGTEQYRNCGHCGKCVRSHLAFMAVGLMEPPCFDGPLELADIDALQTHSMLQYNRLKRIAAYADERGVKDEWLRRVKRRLASYRRQVRRRNRRARIAGNTISVLARLGLKDGIKRGLRSLGLLN